MATTFLHTLGTAGWSTVSGYIVAPFNLIGSTELSGLANGSTAISVNEGISGAGIFNQVDFGQCQRGYIWLTVVTASWVVAPGANICGWWIHGANSTTLLEAQNATNSPARAPDFLIPLMTNTAIVGSTYFANGIPSLPYDNCKVLIQNNNASASLGAGNHTITVAPVGDQY